MRMTRIEYQLGGRRESLADLKAANPDWDVEKIHERTGIDKRYVCADGETALSLGVQAATKALDGLERDSVDGLIYVTQSPDSSIPTTACLLHRELRLGRRGLAFDVNQGCSGFVYGLSLASSLLTVGSVRRCLVVCAETYSKYIAVNDRTCRPVFSDAASAVLVEPDGPGTIGPFTFVTDGMGAPNLTLRGGVSEAPRLFMDGAKVLLFTMSAVPRSVEDLLRQADVNLADVDLFVFHQASRIVIDNIQRVLGIDEKKLVRNYQDVGNTVSATIPIALRQALDDGRLAPGMSVVLVGFGVGYSLAGCVVKF